MVMKQMYKTKGKHRNPTKTARCSYEKGREKDTQRGREKEREREGQRREGKKTFPS